MSDYEMAKKTASAILEHVKVAETLAQPGSFSYHQFLSARLLMDWQRIKFVLETVVKN